MQPKGALNPRPPSVGPARASSVNLAALPEKLSSARLLSLLYEGQYLLDLRKLSIKCINSWIATYPD